MKQAAATAGLPDAARYSGHSLRAGVAAAVIEAGAPLADLMRQTAPPRWRSATSAAPASGATTSVDSAEPPSGRVNRAQLREERDRLRERHMRLTEELEIVEQRIAQLDDLLSPVIDGQAEAAA